MKSVSSTPQNVLILQFSTFPKQRRQDDAPILLNQKPLHTAAFVVTYIDFIDLGLQFVAALADVGARARSLLQRVNPVVEAHRIKGDRGTRQIMLLQDSGL